MSRRFGRNQKRRLIEQLESAEQRAALAEKRYSEIEFLGRRNRQIVEDTAVVLGRHFATLEPETVEVRYLKQLWHGWEVADAEELGSAAEINCVADRAAELVARTLPIIHGEQIGADLQKRVHFRVVYQGREVGYAIDPRTLKLLRDPAQVIAGEVAKFILERHCE